VKSFAKTAVEAVARALVLAVRVSIWAIRNSADESHDDDEAEHITIL
jgi:hypothetical protein